MQVKTVLVTGAAGFIGSHVCELLLTQGYTVVGIDNFEPFYDINIKRENLNNLFKFPGFSFYEIDIRSNENFRFIPLPIDAVIHLAAKAGVLPSLQDPEGYIQTNINGTLYLLNWMKESGITKMVFASSSSIYGNHKTIPYREDLVVDEPISPYAFTKKACELLNHTYHHLYQFDILNLRLFTVYGPRQRPDLAIRKFFTLISEGKEIPVYGDGSTARDYTYVADTAEGIVRALDYVTTYDKVFEIINLGNHSPVRLLDLINTIGEVVGKKPQLKFMPMQPGDVDITYADISKARQLINYNPSTSLKEGLQKFKDWFEGGQDFERSVHHT